MTPEEIKAFVEQALERLDRDPFAKGYDKAMERIAEEILYEALSKDERVRKKMKAEAEQWISEFLLSEAEQRGMSQ